MLKPTRLGVVFIFLSLVALFLPGVAQAKKLNVVTATTDLAALADDRISITPLRLDHTDQPFLSKLAGIFPTK